MAKIDNTKQNSKCRLRVERDEKVNRMISKCRKRSHKTKDNEVEKVIHWEVFKRLKFNNSTPMICVETRISSKE